MGSGVRLEPGRSYPGMDQANMSCAVGTVNSSSPDPLPSSNPPTAFDGQQPAVAGRDFLRGLESRRAAAPQTKTSDKDWRDWIFDNTGIYFYKFGEGALAAGTAVWGCGPGEAVVFSKNGRPIDFTDSSDGGEEVSTQPSEEPTPDLNSEQNEPSENHPPQIARIRNHVLYEGMMLRVPIEVEDPDGDEITIGGDRLPLDAVVDNERMEFRWTPSFDVVRDRKEEEFGDIRIWASDGFTKSTIEFPYVVRKTNRPPTFDPPLRDYEMSPGYTLAFDLNGVDPDKDELSYARLRPTRGIGGWSSLSEDGNFRIRCIRDHRGSEDPRDWWYSLRGSEPFTFQVCDYWEACYEQTVILTCRWNDVD